MTRRFTRREIIARSAIISAASATAGFEATSLGYAANETLNVGCIGTGGRCRRLMQKLAEIPGVRITAVCDVWDQHLEMGRKLADPKAAAVKDYRRLLERQDVDAVLIGSPDHWHAGLMIAACQAGKDVYVEKPLTHDLSEAAALIAAKDNSQRVVQVGMQQRSMPHLQKAREIIQRGDLGPIRKVHLTWNRNSARARNTKLNIDPATVDWKMFLGSARPQPFDAYRFRHWRWFWDFGGGIFTDLMVHFVDVAHWFLGVDHPQMAASIGDHFSMAGIWETPDTVQTVMRYPNGGAQVYFEGTFVNARNAAMMEFMGERATLYADRGRYEIHPERRGNLKPSQMVLGEGPRGADFYTQPDGERLHLINWVECIRTRRSPNATVEMGIGAAAAAHLANLSLRSGEVARWKEAAHG